MSNLNMPVKYCTDENGNPYSPVVYQESMFNDDGTRMDPAPRKMFAKAYDPTKTYPTESLFCINDNKFYKFTGSGTTTGTFDSTKWTETDDAEELTALNSTLTQTLKTTGLSYTNCTYVHGGYVEIGNLVVVNIRVKADDTASASIAGFPAYTSSQGTRVPVTIYCASNETFNKISYLFTNGNIVLGNVSLNNTYAISAVYIKG